MKRRVLSVLLAILMVLSLVPTIFAPKTAVAESGPIDQAIVQGGAILHCFDWSFDEIREALPDIKAAGYAAVQTSPVQPPKDYNASWNDTSGNWWKLYQPIGIRIAGENESWLGTAEDLTELCTAAEQEGIYVIVDIVANHLGNKGDGGYTVNGNNNLSDQVDDDLKNADYFHPEENEINYNTPSDRFNTTHYHMKMPDLNTGNEVIQQKVLDLLKACIDCGVDGFRFDAAKHIEVPADPEGTRSDFWPTVIDGARTYASDKGAYLFIYGEALDDLGTDEVNYTQYIGLTDNVTGNNTRTAVKDQNAGGVNATSIYYRSGNPSSYVIWAESHDNYLNDHTDGIPTEKMIQTWAIVGARANSTALFFARPNERIGLASTDTSWKSPAVAAVNKFKNHYKGKGEYFSYDSASNKTVWIERGTSGGDAGVSIVKLDGAGSVNLDAHLMSSGYYFDEITGNVFTVSGGKISGTVGPTGIAVVYQPTAEPSAPPSPSPEPTTRTLYFKPNSGWKMDGARFAMYSWGSGQHWTSMTRVDGETEDIYEAELPSGDTTVIFVRMNPATTDNNWDNMWNQTGDLVVPSDKNLFTLAEDVWDGATTTWSAYGDVGGGDPTPVTEDEGYYLVGTMTGWSISPEFKMTRTDASTEEYTIDVPLMRTSKPYNSKFKVVYSPDGITKDGWFPAGENNDYGYNESEIPQSGVYTVYFRPNYDGGSDWHDGCIYAERTKFFVTVNDTDKNGTVTVDKDVAAAGETVTVTVTPNEGYALDTLVYMCETGFNTGEFDITEIEGTTFEMPAENAAVKATFVTQWTWLQQQLEEDGADITLDRDIVCIDQDEGPLVVPEDTYVTLDLNGHTVDRNLTEPTENGNVITVMGWLTLLDSSAGQTGVITGGNNLKDGGGVLVQAEQFSEDDNGSFIMYGGTITGNAARDGGGVSVGYWDLDNMEFFEGYFEMYGGVITGNLAATEEQYYGYGGGVYVSEGQFCLFGGEISENHSDLYGGGVYTVFGMSSAPFVVSGAPVVRDNTWGDVPETDNVAIEHWADSSVIYVEDDGLAPEASIGVNVYTIANYDTMEKIPCLEPFTSGLTNGGDASNFVSDFAGYTVILNEDGEAMLAEATTTAPSFAKQSLTLDGKIGVNFYMNLDGLTDEEKAASYMAFEISGKGTVPSDPVTFDADNTNSDGTLYGFSCYVNAIQMADTITATFHYGNGQTIEKQYSIMQYYEAFKEHAGEFDEETRDLVRALVCYGYCTQQFLMEAKNLPLGYDEASYAPIILPGELAEMVASSDYAAIADMIEEDSLLFQIKSTGDENIKGISFMLALDSETKLKVTFKPDPSYTGIATCWIDNANEAEMQKVRGRFVAEVPNIPAHKLGEMHLIYVYTGDNCYSQVASTYTVIEASPMSYVYLMLTRTGATEHEKNCGAAIYTYWQAAQAYKGE